MGSSFYVHADSRDGGPAWAFTRAELAAALTAHWPGASVADSVEGWAEILVEVEPGQWAELSYNLRGRAFSFEDREPWSAPLTVLHTVLRDLAPDVPVVWWPDFDAVLEPFDLAADLSAVLDAFGA
ncbi:hypothetical protein EH183_40590 [Streptomyces sp. CB01881]|uniref:hypothetical protein n=1 Tax=Streptomyces sp. CB01881 TaxID=2078691 RepID=UPI0011DF8DD1|nr:hypothetical protein [Streptomyces sp. CB01881]TYC68157.1 hypothetical protein EH183_40590 [Streptomyces sp. CB01881]